MKSVSINLLLLFVTMLCGCESSHHTQHDLFQHDSIFVQHEKSYITDTVYVEIPLMLSERTIHDSVSRLENDYAASEARINPDGSLSHNLKTKPHKKPVEFQKAVERRDSIVYRERVRTETVEVPRQLTWFQKGSICGFWAAIIILLIVYTIKILKAHIREIRQK